MFIHSFLFYFFFSHREDSEVMKHTHTLMEHTHKRKGRQTYWQFGLLNFINLILWKVELAEEVTWVSSSRGPLQVSARNGASSEWCALLLRFLNILSVFQEKQFSHVLACSRCISDSRDWPGDCLSASLRSGASLVFIWIRKC